jgi:hypothetical protein
MPTLVLRPRREQGVASFGHDEGIVSQLPGFCAALGEGAQCDSPRDRRAPIKRHSFRVSRAAMLNPNARVCVCVWFSHEQ